MPLTGKEDALSSVTDQSRKDQEYLMHPKLGTPKAGSRQVSGLAQRNVRENDGFTQDKL